jgi:hypothetical protein
MTYDNAIELMRHPRKGDHCLLCGGEPMVIGVFEPRNPVAFGGIKGKSRLIRYCLCERCHSDPEAPEKVEKVLEFELCGGAA